ncbi:MAG TPA: ATP-dependent DNA helicase [Alphaproteobacteria bacterium]|nr:ATP-dependent DNA helicase [Alphaproteobacteria bacterium]
MTAAPAPLGRPARLAAPALAVRLRAAAWLSEEGEIETLPLAEARARLARAPKPLVCHRPLVARRLGIDRLPSLDLLELYAFVRPASFVLPTARGLAEALSLAAPVSVEDEALTLLQAAERLLAELAAREGGNADTVALAQAMTRGEWSWGRAVLEALGAAEDIWERSAAFAVWKRLPSIEDWAPEPPSGHRPVSPAEARERLAALLGAEAEDRPQQADYASALSAAFQPRDEAGVPHFVLAEAGTGVGKTLGYLAPASLWAEKNDGPVWISTYTRNLQHQLDRELDRLYPAAAEKARKVVIRKGRENYLCLLNMEEATEAARLNPREAVALGLLARWAGKTRDGDMIGGDFPAWLVDLVGRERSLGLADRRGECIYAACPHYQKCFIERSVRRARRADIVVANHALVMVQAALGGIDDSYLPTRYVFDEGHHVFDAADGAFSAHLSGRETAELRRWLLGAEGRSRSRARGLKRRVEDLVADDAAAAAALDAILKAALALTADGWLQRLQQMGPLGPSEAFLAKVRQQVSARAHDPGTPYDLETATSEPVDGLLDAAALLEGALARLLAPMRTLAARLAARLDDEAAELDSATRLRIEATSRGLARRAEAQVASWILMLKTLGRSTPPEFVDWFSIDRLDGRDTDVGMHRHWVDPTAPFIAAVATRAHGIAVTSATLTDGSGDVEADWQAAEARTGASHLPSPAIRAQVPSPFDYARQTRVVVVTDVRKDSLDQVAAAYRELFLAAGGGGLGLFTAISRLRAVYQRIAPALEEAGVPLLAQHVDALDVSTLIDIFRAEADACLLGTDAVRDGVDVPGRALRLIVFDRVPWARPDLLHRARKAAFGGRRYEDMIARLRLKQAFGRLVRRADDAGVFVLLDPMMPSRLAGAFPPGVALERIGLAQAVALTRDFLAQERAPAAPLSTK